MARRNPTEKQRSRLLQKNAHRCCVCKASGLGLHVHHIDGDATNTVDANLAVLCVEAHDQHHRPNAYARPRHLDLTADTILACKCSWEAFVADARSPAPSVLATVNGFGNGGQVHSAKLVMQWPDGRIECEQVFHLLSAAPDRWADDIVQEVVDLEPAMPLVLIDKLQPVEYCPCCQHSVSHVLREEYAVRLTDPTWATDSVGSIYVNPNQPSLAVIVSLRDRPLFSGSLHLCQGTHLHFHSDFFDERTRLRHGRDTREQALRVVENVLNAWQPALLLYGTGDPDDPTLMPDLELPDCWLRPRRG